MAHERDGGGSGPSFEGPETQVNPSDLDSFATFIDELAQSWASEDEYGYAKQLKQHEPQLKIGTFPSAEQLRTAYENGHESMIGAAGQLHALLKGLAKATKKAADNYKNSAALAAASVQDIEKLLDESLGPVVEKADEQPTNPPSGDGSNSNGSEGS